MNNGYELVRLANGTHSVHSVEHGETFHPAIGPVEEAQSLYVNQLSLERYKDFLGELVVWDIGLGAAANALTLLRAVNSLPCSIRLVSFDKTTEALEFALKYADTLGYFGAFEDHVHEFLHQNRVAFQNGKQSVNWELCLGDFPTLLSESKLKPQDSKRPWPHAILFDPCSPKTNPEMWTLQLFTNLYQALDSQKPCLMPTYSRSTMTRAALCLAGFYVGVGHPTGQKEETTIATNSLPLLIEPLDRKWLTRARASHSAEPLTESIYRQLPLSEESWRKLQAHPQFQGR